jgi:uncharacterized protein involved in exopolysaccharide biosynthesis
MAAEPNPSIQPEYLSFKELVENLRSYVREIRLHKKMVFASLAICLAYGIYHRWMSKKVYEAEVSFMINEEQNAMSGLGGAFSQFTGLLGLGNDINLQKILELAKSRRIAEKVFAVKCRIDDHEDFLANHLISELEKDGKWANSGYLMTEPALKSYRFKEFVLGQFGSLDNRALIRLHELFLEMLSTEVSEKTAIMKLKVEYTNEKIAFELATRLYNEMSNFYIDKMIEKQKETFSDLNLKTDSLKTLIDHKQYKLAGIKDTYRSTWLYKEDVPKTILDQEIRMLQIVYGEALKNKEIASFALETRTPFIQAIDLPIIPLKYKQLGWVKSILLALIIGFIIGAGFISIRKFIRDQLI